MGVGLSCIDDLGEFAEKALAAGFPSLSTELRRRIIRFVGRRGEAPLFTIHKELGYPAISVGRACELLKESGYLVGETRPGRGPKRAKTVYRLTDLGRLAYLVLTWDGLDQVLREALSETKLPPTPMPDVDAWLSEPCLRELLQLSIYRAVEKLKPEENYVSLREEYGDVLVKFVVFGSFVTLWSSVSLVFIESLVEEMREKTQEEAVGRLLDLMKFPFPFIAADFLVREEFAKIRKERRSKIAVEMASRGLHSYLKILINIYAMSLLFITLLLEAYEGGTRKRHDELLQALKQVFGDIIPP